MNSIIEIFSTKGFLLQKDAFDYINSKKNPLEFAEMLLKEGESLPSIISCAFIKTIEKKFGNEMENNEKREDATKLLKSENGFRIIQDITSSSCQGEANDFVMYFKDRYEKIRKILKDKKEIALRTSISKLQKYANFEQKFIGIVSDIKKTTKGHKLITIEDDSKEILTLIPSNSELINLNIVQDEVIGIVGKFSQKGDLFIIQNIIFPEFKKTNSNKAEAPVDVAFISDTHYGSKTFLIKEWKKFLEWIKKEDRIKYLVIGGDIVDGIGNYPNQEDELEINDIFTQYEEFSQQLINIPDNIKIIMLPGNHDAVRQAEPQPTFPNEIKKYFDSNIKFVGNPCYFSLYNVEILAYHGRSLDDWIQEFSTTYSNAINMMKEMLKRRHLAPMYGRKVSLVPTNNDYLVIENIPDIFVMGHGHSWGIENHKGIVLINSSTWQSQTIYQKMLNQVPIPCKVSIISLDRMEYKVKSFA